MRKRSVALVSALVAAVLGMTATPAHAASSSYVALGDSYSSGVGTRNYYRDGTGCKRSPQTYGVIIAARHGLDLTLAACTGAVTSDVVTSQVSSLRRGTRYVSITIGGNDMGFRSVLTECGKPRWMSNCSSAINGGLDTLRTKLPGRLTTVLAAVRYRSPRATVVVAGYPHVFNGEDCNAATFFSTAEQVRFNRAIDELNALLRRKSKAAGMIFVNPVTRFGGHAVCDSPEWMNGFSNPVSDSYHPNVRGYRAYASLVGEALIGSSAQVSAD